MNGWIAPGVVISGEIEYEELAGFNTFHADQPFRGQGNRIAGPEVDPVDPRLAPYDMHPRMSVDREGVLRNVDASDSPEAVYTAIERAIGRVAA